MTADYNEISLERLHLLAWLGRAAVKISPRYDFFVAILADNPPVEVVSKGQFSIKTASAYTVFHPWIQDPLTKECVVLVSVRSHYEPLLGRIPWMFQKLYVQVQVASIADIPVRRRSRPQFREVKKQVSPTERRKYPIEHDTITMVRIFEPYVP
jgi:hypothetical protein